MLSGEYDHSGTVELGRQAHEAIAGSTFDEMGGVGHFPMSEDPERLRDHLLPILKQIQAAGSSGQGSPIPDRVSVPTSASTVRHRVTANDGGPRVTSGPMRSGRSRSWFGRRSRY